MIPEHIKKTLGSTGKFPAGKLNPDDKGELKLAVGADLEKKTIIIDFGSKGVTWIGLDITTAKIFIESLQYQLKRIENGN